MLDDQKKARAHSGERIDVQYDYALCTWARHFNVSETRVKEAVAAVGDRADSVRRHLLDGVPSRPSGQERPSRY